MINSISKSWKDKLAHTMDGEVRVYIDPRRVEYAPISGTSTYYENLETDPANGQYSLDISTAKYISNFSLPITFEVYCKPRFAYDVATDQEFFVFSSDSYDSARVALCYYSGTDQIGLKAYTSTGGASASQVDVKLATVYTNNEDLQKWIKITATISSSGINIYRDGTNQVTSATDISSHKNKCFLIPGNGCDIIINYAFIYYGFEATSDNILNSFKNIKNECVFYNFQGVGLGNTRCDITNPYVKNYTHTYKDGYTAAEMQLNILNENGSFSADQYAPFSPAQYSYNGTLSEKYLAKNAVGVSLEYRSQKRSPVLAGELARYEMSNLPNMPDCSCGASYANEEWATTDSWTTGANEGSLYVGNQIIRNIGVVAGNKIAIQNTTGRASTANETLRIRIRSNRTYTMEAFYYPSGVKTSVGTFSVSKDWTIYEFTLSLASAGIRLESTATAIEGDLFLIDFIYIGHGLYETELADTTGNNYGLTTIGPYPYSVLSGNGLMLDGISDHCMVPLISTPDILSLTTWCYINAFDSTACPISTHFYNASDSYGFGMSFVNATTIRVHYGQGVGSAATYKDIAVSSYSLSTLYHWAFTYNSTDKYFRVYRNGALVGTSTASATFNAKSYFICIGNYPYMNKTLLTTLGYDYLVNEDGDFLEGA